MGSKVEADNEREDVVEKYGPCKWKKIMDTTQGNYSNMLKRLNRRYKVSNYVLIYYSIFLIVITLTGKYFPHYFNTELGEYFGIILSVIVLAYSLVNNSANYSIRISNIENALNRLKTIKRELKEDNIAEQKEKYYTVTDSTERREDVDFFITVKHLCKKYNINWLTKKTKNKGTALEERSIQEKVVNDYISEINVFLEECIIVLEYIWYILLFIVPIIVFIICII